MEMHYSLTYPVRYCSYFSYRCCGGNDRWHCTQPSKWTVTRNSQGHQGKCLCPNPKQQRIQEQLDSLVGMVLQNWRTLDPLTAGQGETCIHLKEECCFYFNQPGQVSIQNILKSTDKIEHFGTGTLVKNWQFRLQSLLLPLIIPLTILFILLLLGLPFLN